MASTRLKDYAVPSILAAFMLLLLIGNVAYTGDASVKTYELALAFTGHRNISTEGNTIRFELRKVQNASASVAIKNDLQYDCIYNLSFSGPMAEDGWLKAYPKNEFELKPGQSRNVTVLLMPPADADGTYSGRFIITARTKHNL